jgi:hypothetical protein
LGAIGSSGRTRTDADDRELVGVSGKAAHLFTPDVIVFTSDVAALIVSSLLILRSQMISSQ